MKRLWIQGAFWVLTIAMAVGMTTVGNAQPNQKRVGSYEPQLVPVGPNGLREQRGGLRVDVWTNRGDGAVLTPGTPVKVFFRTNQDAFVTLYNIEANGRVRVLFPRRGDGFVRAGETVRLPKRRHGGRLVVGGAPGEERLVAVATYRPHNRRQMQRVALGYPGPGHRARRAAVGETWFTVAPRRGGWCPW